MNIPMTVKSWLAAKGGRFKGRRTYIGKSFEETVALAGLSLEQVVRPVMLKTGKTGLMVIVRANQEPDLERIGSLFKRQFSLCTPEESVALLKGCDAEALPPLPGAFGIRAIMDVAVEAMPRMYFAVGIPGLFISADAEAFSLLQGDTWKGHRIAREATRKAGPSTLRDTMRNKIRQLDDLPVMPGIASELIRIKNNPYAHAGELAAVIEQDPSLSAQLIRYANSPLCTEQSKVGSVEQAILQVLGMDFVQDFALGLSLGKAFNNPRDGALGLDNFWRHAVYVAALSQALCESIDYHHRPASAMAYQAGLLHNFGILLLGHLFPEEFERLDRARVQHPKVSLLDLEEQILGTSHTEMGQWLMEAWHMPREIVTAVTGHHQPGLQGDYAIYANLVYLANALLGQYGIGEDEEMLIPPDLLDRVGLNEAHLDAALDKVLKDREGLDFMASKMVA